MGSVINDILGLHKSNATIFGKWYMKAYDDKYLLPKFLTLPDDMKIFVILIFLDEVVGVNINADKNSICISYNLKVLNPGIVTFVNFNRTGVFYNKYDKVNNALDEQYIKGIDYVFQNLIF